MRLRPTKSATVTCLALTASLAPVMAQEGIIRTPLQMIEFPSGYQTVTGIAVVPANTCSARHTHPGVEFNYAMEGEIILKADGKPEEHLKAGESYQIAAGVPHSACTVGGFKSLTVHIIEKGRPLASPAP